MRNRCVSAPSIEEAFLVLRTGLEPALVRRSRGTRRRRNLRIRNPWPINLYKGLQGVSNYKVTDLKRSFSEHQCASFELANRFRLTPASAASIAKWR